MNVTLLEVPADLERIRPIWLELTAGEPPSYFLSWGLLSCWFRQLPSRVRLHFVLATEEGRPILGFFVGRAPRIHNRLSRSLYLNACGEPGLDLYVEYNAIPVATSRPPPLAEVVSHLPWRWDELVMPGLDPSRYPGSRLDEIAPPLELFVEREDVAPFVDLEVARSRGDYLSLISANSRRQIRRALRGWEEAGPVSLRQAESVEEALEIFEELRELHQATWTARGMPGALASDFKVAFHRALIEERFDHGELQLLRITAGSETLGCLYNFIHRGRAWFYKSGVRYPDDARLKAGYVCHVEAIRHNLALGHAAYDFLAPASRYKVSLATHENRLLWVRARKPRLRFRLLDALRLFKGRSGARPAAREAVRPAVPGRGSPKVASVARGVRS